MDSVFTVTVAATDRSLLDIAELRDAAGVTGSGQDTKLTALGLQVSDAIAKACRVIASAAAPPTLLAETCQEIFRPRRWADRLFLSRRPVTEIVSITEDGEALASTDYELDGRPGLLSRLSGDQRRAWPACSKIVVTYKAGYAAAPSDLKLAASKLTAALWLDPSRDPNLKRVRVDGVGEREYWIPPTGDPLFSSEMTDLLRPYMNRWTP